MAMFVRCASLLTYHRRGGSALPIPQSVDPCKNELCYKSTKTRVKQTAHDESFHPTIEMMDKAA